MSQPLGLAGQGIIKPREASIQGPAWPSQNTRLKLDTRNVGKTWLAWLANPLCQECSLPGENQGQSPASKPGSPWPWNKKSDETGARHNQNWAKRGLKGVLTLAMSWPLSQASQGIKNPGKLGLVGKPGPDKTLG